VPYLIMNREFKRYKVIKFNNIISIGRGDRNDIILNDENDTAISRHHAYIDFQDNHYILYDQSRNGTLVNNESVNEYTLSQGSIFQIIDYFFTFVDDTSVETINQKSKKKHEVSTEQSSQQFDETCTTLIDKSEDYRELKDQLIELGVVAESDKMLSLYHDVQEIAGINVPVLITGEPGTGKEKVAIAIHKFSKAKGDFIALNCSSIPEGLFESELFGSTKGAFNNAVDKPGKLELANNGTIFLDEVGDMNLALQPKLLRFLEDKKLTRLGDTNVRHVDARVVAATNQDLKNKMGDGSFRKDFFQRLACIQLKIPPLKERRQDIFPLSHFLLSKYSKEHNLGAKRISDDAKKMLTEYDWPGNVRELGNILLSAAIRSKGRTILAENLTAYSDDIKRKKVRDSKEIPSIKEMEKQNIIDALKHTGWKKSEACKLLGISRDTLYKKIKKYNISAKS